MKKLLILLLAIALIFTACGEKEETQPTFSYFAEKFVFDETAIVSSEEKIDGQLKNVTEFDSQGRPVRETTYIPGTPEAMPATVKEYMYNDNSSFAMSKTTFYTPLNPYRISFTQPDAAGTTEIGFDIHSDNRLSFTETVGKTETGSVVTHTAFYYDDTGRHSNITVTEKDKLDRPVKVTGIAGEETVNETFYEYGDDGILLTIYDYQPNASWAKSVVQQDVFGNPLRQDNYDKDGNLIEYYIYNYKNMDENGVHTGVGYDLYSADGTLKNSNPA